MPLLKREVLEKQIDYERDPLFRDRGNQQERETGSNLFDRILDNTSTHTEAQKQRDHISIKKVSGGVQANQKHQQEKRKPSSKQFSIIGAAISVTIVVLLGLIIYLIAN
jgi:hypothetical protein